SPASHTKDTPAPMAKSFSATFPNSPVSVDARTTVASRSTGLRSVMLPASMVGSRGSAEKSAGWRRLGEVSDPLRRGLDAGRPHTELELRRHAERRLMPTLGGAGQGAQDQRID